MPLTIKAIVFKTPQLKETRHFFETELSMPVKEISLQHFVLYAKGIRMVFMESEKNFEIEFYLNDAATQSIKEKVTGSIVKNYKDPNGIKIITVHKPNHKQ